MSYRAKFIHTYGHNGHVGVLVELSLLGGSITIRMPEFLELANDVAMHIAASRPANLEALLSQPFVKDTSVTVAGYISKVSRQLKEDVAITRFVRWDDEPPQPGVPPDRPAQAVRMAVRK